MRKIIVFLIALGWLFSFPGFYSILPGIRKAYADGWYNTSWQYRKKITIDNTKVAADLTDFPVLISITDTDLRDDALDSGNDILFTSSDGTTKLSHEIESFSGTTGDLIAWVKVPSVADTTDTVIYMYYSNSTASSQQDAVNVWDSNYKGVWHLKESGNGTASEFTDSTSTAVHGQGGGGTASAVPTRATGKIGYGQSSDGTNDYINIPDNGNFTLTASTSYTWSTWIKNAAFTEWSTVWSQTIDSNRFFYYYAHTSSDATAGPVTAGVTVYWQSSAGNQLVAHTSNNVLDTTSFHYVALTYDSSLAQASRLKIYVDGTDVTATGDIASAGTIASINPTDIRMTSNQPFGEYYNGVVDEQRYSKTARASSWIQTEYNNQNSPSTFYSVGSEEQLSTPVPEPTLPRVTLTINSTNPADGATSVAIDTTVSATFSMRMNGSTLAADTFKLKANASNVSGTVMTQAETARFTPSSNLASNTKYTATITTGARAANYAGTTLDNNYSWSFTTTEDTDPPTIISTSPANGAAAVTLNSTISATFSEAVRASTIGVATFTVNDGNSDIGGTVSYSGTTATFTPSNNLSAFTTYTATITTGVKDTAGNAMASDYTWSFTTIDTIKPTVISTSPADGDTGVSLDSTITATFSETMDASTITTDTFIVSNDNSRINGSVSYKGRTATFTPSSDLSDSTAYTATITTGAKDLAGNAISSDCTWSFTTVDTAKPTVLSTNPADDATGVALDTTVSATFSETMDTSTITTNIFVVSTNGSRINGTVSYSGRTAVFTPSSNLSDSTTYTATITTGAKDAAGNAIATAYTWNFTTGDFSRPTVTSTSPVSTATEVTLSSIITATFNETMDASTINTNTFTVSSGNKKVTGTVSYSNITATFMPSKNLSDSTTYTATITTGARDASGNVLASNYSWSFTTVDTTPPKVISTNPAKNATGVALNSTVTATFSETMDASTITADTFTVSNGSSNISGIFSYSGTTATFTPSRSLLNSTIYTATITTGVNDVAGNAIASNYTWSFTTTGDNVPPTVISTSPANGASDIALNSIISATFSETMGTSTITTDTFMVSTGSSNIDGKVEYGDKTAIFTPSNNLSPFTTYTARITTGALDANGNALASDYTWSFVTSAEVDGTSPTITSTSPSNGAADADITGAINATFSKTMNVFTINTDTFIISTGNSNVIGKASYSNKTATFTPSNNLSSYTTYMAKITTGALDTAGNALVSDYTWSFTTMGDFTPPTVISTSPANGDAGVDLNSVITATFSERMDASSINTNTFIVNDGVNNINGSVTYNSETTSATFTFPDDLFSSTTYTVSITAGVKDLAGNAMAANYTWSFTTESASIIPTSAPSLSPIPTPTAYPTSPIPTPTAVSSPTPTPIVIPTELPTLTPLITPSVCDAEQISVFPGRLKLKREESKDVTVTLTGKEDCPVEGVKVRAKITKGEKLISVSPESAITDDNGQTEFTITALKGVGSAKIQVESNNVKEIVRVKVVN